MMLGVVHTWIADKEYIYIMYIMCFACPSLYIYKLSIYICVGLAIF